MEGVGPTINNHLPYILEKKMAFIIERNVPIPEATRGTNKNGKWSGLAKCMDVGDSVLLNDHKEARTLYQALRKMGCNGAQRKGRHTEDDKTWQAYRVWRVK